MTIGEAYLRIAEDRFRRVKGLGDGTFRQLSERDFYERTSQHGNSIAIIVQHLSGNMVSRWTDVMTSDGEKSFRNRDQEFEPADLPMDLILEQWEKGWETLFNALRNLTEEDLLKTIYIRSEGHMVLEAIERQMAHYAYHVGQIVYLGKEIKGGRWESLSIPKGSSDQYAEEMKRIHGKNGG
ncbi:MULTISPECIES: DUF1572 family protein [Pontibacillus]|uniref:DUF1572 family protein n=1 Tax=Pontibacillus chungwhensis TaxID=265426 RepID=A0ABY8UTQ2_9BACI|nr:MULTISPECIES: DUF1572 family protein [Pontibacillus]MCD5323196.1 DUF1572 domain-containing protein [Pontibacillus sp. HN14]WIF96583.1 DUF1572 family protein [Pontibacillus chungwhensis]